MFPSIGIALGRKKIFVKNAKFWQVHLRKCAPTNVKQTRTSVKNGFSWSGYGHFFFFLKKFEKDLKYHRIPSVQCWCYYPLLYLIRLTKWLRYTLCKFGKWGYLKCQLICEPEWKESKECSLKSLERVNFSEFSVVNFQLGCLFDSTLCAVN